MSYELVEWKPAACHTGYKKYVQLEDRVRRLEPTIASLMAFSASSLPRMSSTFTSLCSFCNSRDIHVDARLPTPRRAMNITKLWTSHVQPGMASSRHWH